MKTFTIDNDNNISVFATQEEAAAATATPFDSFASQQELADLADQWPGERLLAVWNSLPGVTPVKKFTDRKTAISRVWARIQGLGEPVAPRAGTPASKVGTPAATPASKPEPKADQPAKPKTQRKAKGGAQAAKRGARAAKGAPAKGKATKKGHRCQGCAQGQNGSQGAGTRRAARGQQDRPGGGHAATEGRSDDFRDHEDHGLAAAYRPRLHGRRDEEGRVRGRVLQAGGRRT